MSSSQNSSEARDYMTRSRRVCHVSEADAVVLLGFQRVLSKGS